MAEQMSQQRDAEAYEDQDEDDLDDIGSGSEGKYFNKRKTKSDPLNITTHRCWSRKTARRSSRIKRTSRI